jgi:hypothetical protein
VLVHAVVDEAPPEPLAQLARQRLPGRVLDEDDRIGAESMSLGDLRERLRRLGQRLAGQRPRVDLEVVFAGQRDLEDARPQLPDFRLPVEAEEARLRVEDAVAVLGETGEELLGALEAKTPVDDGKTKDVEPAGRRKRRDAFGDASAQEPYLATAPARAVPDKTRPAGRCSRRPLERRRFLEG